MTTKPNVFVSYRHTDGDWVLGRLKPAFEAAGVQVLIDVERFLAGGTVIGEADSTQDAASRMVPVLTQEYFASDYCRHELYRALSSGARTDRYIVPIRRDAAEWPESLKDVLYVDLQDDQNDHGWWSLLRACGGDLGTSVPHWLDVTATLARHLQRRESVNLIVDSGLNGDPLVSHLTQRRLPSPLVPDLKIVDLESGRTSTREGLLREILRVFGSRVELPPRPNDLVRFAELMDEMPDGWHGWLALKHFDAVGARQSDYTIELFRELRYRVTTCGALTLLLQSRGPYGVVLPQEHPLSEIRCLQVPLQKRP